MSMLTHMMEQRPRIIWGRRGSEGPSPHFVIPAALCKPPGLRPHPPPPSSLKGATPSPPPSPPQTSRGRSAGACEVHVLPLDIATPAAAEVATAARHAADLSALGGSRGIDAVFFVVRGGEGNRRMPFSWGGMVPSKALGDWPPALLASHIAATPSPLLQVGATQRALVEDTSPDVDEALFRLNVLAPMRLAKAVLPDMLRAGRGHLVVISSIAGKTAAPVQATYAATKHGARPVLLGGRSGVFERLPLFEVSSSIVVPDSA